MGGETHAGDHKHFLASTASVQKVVKKKAARKSSCVVPMTMAEGTIIPDGKRRKKKCGTLQRTE